MKKKITYLLLFTLVPLFARAEVSEPFWLEQFTGAFPTGWSTDDASGQGIIWEQCSSSQQCPPATYQNIGCSEDYFKSPGFQDGYMYLDMYGSDVLTTPVQAYLRTPTIDCSNKSAVFLKFQTYIHATYSSPEVTAILRVRSGNEPWTEYTIFPNLNLQTVELQRSYNPQQVQFDISAVAANKPNVAVEWRWTTTSGVAWMIDEVALFDENPMFENVIWGKIPGQGDFNGGLNGWTVINTQFDTCRWVWVDSAMLNLPLNNAKAEALACWPGVENGAALMNASYCSRYGLPTTSSRSDLRSPTIDLSAVPAGTRLLLKFDQVVALGNLSIPELPRASVAISVNNGQTYMDTITLNPLLPFLKIDCGEMSVALPNEVAGKPQVRLRFIFASDTHFWMLDNIRIAYAYDYDLALNPAFYNVAPDFSVPSSQVRPIGLFAMLRNAGNLPIENVTAHVEVRNAANLKVFQDSIQLGLMLPSEVWTEASFPNQFLPEDQTDSFLVFYSLKSSEVDQYPNNNRAEWRYHVTQDFFSKNEYCTESIRYFFPSESVDYEIGNCYFIPKGSNLKAVSLSFAFDGEDDLGDEQAQLSTRFYKWSNGDNHGDVNSDTLANPDEYELIGFNIYDVSGEENNVPVTVPISYQDEEGILLEDSTYYFVTVGYLDPVYDNNGNAIRFPIAGSEEINYTAMFYNSYFGEQPAFVSMLREGDETDFRANPWTLRRIPFVNLNVAPYVNALDDPRVNAQVLTIYPNPANDFVRVSTEIHMPQQPIRVEIFDLCGRRLIERSFDGGNVSQLSISVGELSNGTYSVRVITGDLLFSEKLLIIH